MSRPYISKQYSSLKRKVMAKEYIPGINDVDVKLLNNYFLCKKVKFDFTQVDFFRWGGGGVYFVPLSKENMARNMLYRYYEKKGDRYVINDEMRKYAPADMVKSYRTPYSEGLNTKTGKGGGDTATNKAFANLK